MDAPPVETSLMQLIPEVPTCLLPLPIPHPSHHTPAEHLNMRFVAILGSLRLVYLPLGAITLALFDPLVTLLITQRAKKAAFKFNPLNIPQFNSDTKQKDSAKR